jgi:hypothetical protein
VVDEAQRTFRPMVGYAGSPVAGFNTSCYLAFRVSVVDMRDANAPNGGIEGKAKCHNMSVTQ